MDIAKQARVLLVEDDPGIIDFVSMGLSEAGYEISVAAEGPEGLRLACKADHDVILLDLMLPGMGGIEILQRLRASGVKTPVLIVSAKLTVNDKVLGLRSGGDDYLVKPFAFAELLARIESLLRRSAGNSEPVRIKILDLTIDFLTRRVFRDQEEIRLQPRELSLLEYLARNSGRVVTRTEILQNVWGYTYDPSTKLVEVHISNLREKIELPNRPKLLKTIRNAGYVLVDDEELSV